MAPTEEPRPGFMLFGSFINPNQPPAPPQPQPPPRAPLADRKRRRTTNIQQKPKPLPPPLQRLLLSMGGSNPTHIFTRTLFESDVKKGLTRLTIPHNQILIPFLTDQEEALLEGCNRLEVKVIDPLLAVRALKMTRWNYKSCSVDTSRSCSWSYAVNGGWMDLVRCNCLVAGDIIHVWSFRMIDGHLGFILSKVGDGKDGSSSGEGGGSSNV